jgi:hypothetical protein
VQFYPASGEAMDEQARYLHDVKRIVWLLFVNVTSTILLVSLYWSSLTDSWQLGMAFSLAAISANMIILWLIKIRAQQLVSSNKSFTASTHFP